VKTAAILDGRQDNPIRMVLCGSGDNWRNVKNASSGSRSITVLERLNRTELVTLLGRSEVGIAPFRDIENYQKNIPNKIYEYLAMKLALVSPVTGCIRRLIEEQGVGITYEPEDAESLARSLLNLAADRERLADCRNRAWTYFTGNMDAERIYDGYCDLIEGAGSRG
jgi:glycosyltransferase involved in cell wall biosynthesis